MSRTPSAACPKCRAKNLTHRRVCWKCGQTLPTSIMLQATKAYSLAQPIAETTSGSKVATAELAEETTSRGTNASRAEFREVVRGLLEKCGIS